MLILDYSIIEISIHFRQKLLKKSSLDVVTITQVEIKGKINKQTNNITFRLFLDTACVQSDGNTWRGKQGHLAH